MPITSFEEIKPQITREARIKEEDSRLLESPTDRRTRLLDYLRRGRLADNIDIMPEIVDALPKVLDTLDFSAENFNEVTVAEQLINLAREIEAEVRQVDLLARQALAPLGLSARAELYLDGKRLAYLQNLVKIYKEVNLDKIQSANPAETARLNFIRNLNSCKLLEPVNPETVKSFAEAADVYTQFLAVNLSVPDMTDPAKQAIYSFITEPKDQRGRYQPETQGFSRVPKISEYTGPVIAPEDLEVQNWKPRRFIGVIKRGQIPEVRKELADGHAVDGALIIDGNIGYTDQGDLAEVEGLTIIDHHDQLEQSYNGKSSDTATTLMFRIIDDRLKAAGYNPRQPDPEKWRKAFKEYVEEFGARYSYQNAEGETREGRKLRIYINHLDSDSVLSAWVCLNPRKALAYREIISKISVCGDFLLGSRVLEYGATARDYEYIIREYLKTCDEQFKRQKAAGPEARLAELAAQVAAGVMEKLKAQLAEIEQGDLEIQRLITELRLATAKDKGRLGQELNRARQANPELIAVQAQLKAQEILLKEQAALQKEVEQIKKTPLTPEENSIILNHLLSSVEEIITQPFKYQKFLQAGRQAEQATIQQIGELYRTGEIEIQKDERDPEIVRITPLGSAHLPDYASIDGLYFFLRKREDFNQPIVVTQEGRFFMAAINTQNARDLQRYDFNQLINIYKTREAEVIQEKISALSAQEPLDKAQQKTLKGLEDDAQQNKSGKLWRNRTQMVFCLKSHLAPEELMHILRTWKVEMQSKEEIKAK